MKMTFFNSIIYAQDRCKTGPRKSSKVSLKCPQAETTHGKNSHFFKRSKGVEIACSLTFNGRMQRISPRSACTSHLRTPYTRQNSSV